MIIHPRPGSHVQIWYRREVAPHMPLHGRVVIVGAASRGPGPRNHAIEVEGRVYSVPAGNLRRAQ